MRDSCFHLHFRKCPFKGGYAVAAGLEPALDFLTALHFTDEECAYLSTLQDAQKNRLFPDDFLRFLQDTPNGLEVDAIPEGTAVFPHEPLLRVSGSGDIDVGAGRIDVLVKATVVETLQGQGGPELQSLRGLTVPVRLVGPLDAVGYRVDAASLLRDLARRKLQDKLEDKARGTLPPAQQQLLEKFKGLFGK